MQTRGKTSEIWQVTYCLKAACLRRLQNELRVQLLKAKFGSNKLNIKITGRLHCFPLLTLLSFPVDIYMLMKQRFECCNAQSKQSVLSKEVHKKEITFKRYSAICSPRIDIISVKIQAAKIWQTTFTSIILDSGLKLLTLLLPVTVTITITVVVFLLVCLFFRLFVCLLFSPNLFLCCPKADRCILNERLSTALISLKH